MKDKGSLIRFSIFVHYQREKASMSFFPGKSFVSSVPDNDAKKMLFLSLYFKALKYTVKSFEKIEKVKDRKVSYTKMGYGWSLNCLFLAS